MDKSSKSIIENSNIILLLNLCFRLISKSEINNELSIISLAFSTVTVLLFDIFYPSSSSITETLRASARGSNIDISG